MGHGQLESIGAITLILRTRAGGGSRTRLREQTVSDLVECCGCDETRYPDRIGA
jgi:hypothetical protein